MKNEVGRVVHLERMTLGFNTAVLSFVGARGEAAWEAMLCGRGLQLLHRDRAGKWEGCIRAQGPCNEAIAAVKVGAEK